MEELTSGFYVLDTTTDKRVSKFCETEDEARIIIELSGWNFDPDYTIAERY